MTREETEQGEGTVAADKRPGEEKDAAWLV